MSEPTIYIIILSVSVFILNSNISFALKKNEITHENSLMVVEHLSQYASKKKNYRYSPQNYQSHGYKIIGKISGNDAYLDYSFPLIYNNESNFTIKLNAHNVSSVISQFGCEMSCFESTNIDGFILRTDNISHLKEQMNQDGFYFKSLEKDGFGINYKHVIQISTDLTSQIASFLLNELNRHNKDSYENRIQSALNFVQFIPYGVPHFDSETHSYMGLAIPHESLAISYSDCDSKSTLFAGILHHLIAPENIILVSCLIDEGAHMITGVAGLNYPGQYYNYNNKEFLLIETTVPIPLESQPSNKFKEVNIIPIS